MKGDALVAATALMLPPTPPTTVPASASVSTIIDVVVPKGPGQEKLPYHSFEVTIAGGRRQSVRKAYPLTNSIIDF